MGAAVHRRATTAASSSYELIVIVRRGRQPRHDRRRRPRRRRHRLRQRAVRPADRGHRRRPDDVLFRGGFERDGDWIKHNVLKADRADGFYLRNMTFELSRENAVYVHETDGYVIDRVVARYNDLYGILTFTSDHGLIRDCETHHNGDSGVYPGSAADVNATTPRAAAAHPVGGRGHRLRHPPQRARVLGHGRQLGVLPRQPRAPQRRRLRDRLVRRRPPGHAAGPRVDRAQPASTATTRTTTPNVQAPDAPCQAERPADVGYERGRRVPGLPACRSAPACSSPAATTTSSRDNDIYDNWRNGVMLFWVPGAIRGDYDAARPARHVQRQPLRRQPDGLPPGRRRPAQRRSTSGGTTRASATAGRTTCRRPAPSPTTRSCRCCPTARPAPLLPVGNAVKSVELLPCSEYNRNSNPRPADCDWFEHAGGAGRPPGRARRGRAPPHRRAGRRPALRPSAGAGRRAASTAPAGHRPTARRSALLRRGDRRWRPSPCGIRAAGPSAVIGRARRPHGASGSPTGAPVLLVLAGRRLAATSPPSASTARAPVRFATGAEVVTLPMFGADGSHVLHYHHGETVTFYVPARQRRPAAGDDRACASVTTSGRCSRSSGRRSAATTCRCGSAPGRPASVQVTARYGNCRYYHEREIRSFPRRSVDGAVLGVDVDPHRGVRPPAGGPQPDDRRLPRPHPGPRRRRPNRRLTVRRCRSQ